MRRMLIAPVAALTLVAASLPAQDVARDSAEGYKSPATARVVGILPGAGHVYAGEPLRGVAYFATTAGMIMLGALMLGVDCIGYENCSDSRAPALALLTGFAAWGFSIYDAGRAAERTNAKRRQLRVSMIAAPRRSMRAGKRDVDELRLGFSVAGVGR